ncbi:MAG: hypothetical protein AAFZ07_25735 [Actinomycetota bacterium]
MRRRQAWVYCAFTTDGDPGYVGSGYDPRARWRRHMREADWARFVAGWAVLSPDRERWVPVATVDQDGELHFVTDMPPATMTGSRARKMAYGHETDLIEQLQPPWNVAGNEDHTEIGRVRDLLGAAETALARRQLEAAQARRDRGPEPTEVLERWDRAVDVCRLGGMEHVTVGRKTSVRRTKAVLHVDEMRWVARGVWEIPFKPAPGIELDLYVAKAEALAGALEVERVSIRRVNPHRGLLTLSLVAPFEEPKRWQPPAEPGATEVVLADTDVNRPVAFEITILHSGSEHWLFGGSTGAGKSNAMGCAIAGLCCIGPQIVIYGVDPKLADMSDYRHRFNGLVVDPDETNQLFRGLVDEMNYRRWWLAQQPGKRNLYECRHLPDCPPIIEVAIDEAADLFLDERFRIARAAMYELARKVRALGIQFLVGTQSPQEKILPTAFRQLLNTRMVGKTEGPNQTLTMFSSPDVAHRTRAQDLPNKSGHAYLWKPGAEIELVRSRWLDPEIVPALCDATMRWKNLEYGMARDGTLISPRMSEWVKAGRPSYDDDIEHELEVALEALSAEPAPAEPAAPGPVPSAAPGEPDRAAVELAELTGLMVEELDGQEGMERALRLLGERSTKDLELGLRLARELWDRRGGQVPA